MEDRLNNRRRHTHIRPSFLRPTKIEDSQSGATAESSATNTSTTTSTKLKAFVDKNTKKESSYQVGNYVGFTREECLGYCYRFRNRTTSGLESTDTDNTSSGREGVVPVNVEDKKGLQSSGGYMLLGDTLALFINLLGPGGESMDRPPKARCSSKAAAAARKYPNEFLDSGRFFTWFVESSRMRTLLYRKEAFPLSNSGEGTTGTDTDTREVGSTSVVESPHTTNQVYLFVRQKRGQYIHCGRCKLIHSEPAYSSSTSPQRGGMTKLLFELVDYYHSTTTTTHTPIGVNDYTDDITNTTTTTATITTTASPSDNWNDLQNSLIYSNAISSHIEELHSGTR